MLDLHQLQVGRKRVAQGIERVAVREHDDRVRTLPQEFDEHIRFFAAKGPKVVALEVEGDRVAIARIEDDRRRRVAAVFLKLRDPPQRCSIACVPGNEEVVAQADEGKGKRRDGPRPARGHPAAAGQVIPEGQAERRESRHDVGGQLGARQREEQQTPAPRKKHKAELRRAARNQGYLA